MIDLILLLCIIFEIVEFGHSLRLQKVVFDHVKVQAIADGLNIPSSPSKFDNITHLTFVSSNARKIMEVKLILGFNFPWEIRTHSVDLEEPQATPIEVSRSKCRQAIELCDGPVIVEDTSLCFNALNGMPGPYIKWFYEAIGNEGLVKLLDGFEDKSGQYFFYLKCDSFLIVLFVAYAQCVLSFCLGRGHEVKTFVGSTEGTIVPVDGPQGFGWDPIFRPDGSAVTFAAMSSEKKNKISHRYRALRQLKVYINSLFDIS